MIEPEAKVTVDSPSRASGEPKKPRGDGAMYLKDWLTLTVATGALVVSMATLYVGNLQVQDQLTARVLGMHEEPHGSTHESVWIQIVFANTGNRLATIVRAAYFAGPDPELVELYRGQSSDAATAIPPFPLVLQPREAKTVLFPVEKKYLASRFKEAGPVTVHGPTSRYEPGSQTYQPSPTKKDSPSERQLYIDLDIWSIDSLGNLHKAETPLLGTVHVTEADGVTAAVELMGEDAATPAIDLYPPLPVKK